MLICRRASGRNGRLRPLGGAKSRVSTCPAVANAGGPGWRRVRISPGVVAPVDILPDVRIPYSARDFPAAIPATGDLVAPWPRLIRAAVSLYGSAPGISPSATPASPGPTRLEARWRSALVLANLRRDGFNYVPSSAFWRLDPSEKGAVSFFLGQVSAKVFAEDLLGAPVFARVDECLSYAGLPLAGQRPDFLAWGAALGSYAVEVKGRSPGTSVSTLDWTTWKAQAAALPLVLGGGSATSAVAHLGVFRRRDDVWIAELLDPPQQPEDGVPVASLLAAYYAPLARLLDVADSERHDRAGQTYLLTVLDDAGLRFGLREDVVEVLPALMANVPGTSDRLLQLLREDAPDIDDDDHLSAGADGSLTLVEQAYLTAYMPREDQT
jgi:hypothetical protein